MEEDPILLYNSLNQFNDAATKRRKIMPALDKARFTSVFMTEDVFMNVNVLINKNGDQLCDIR